jgi:predicted RNA-binding protein YlxR (DUF448 family)
VAFSSPASTQVTSHRGVGASWPWLEAFSARGDPPGASLRQQGGIMARRRRIHVPQRTCVGCRQVRPQREMIRVVRTPDAGVQVDLTGKRAGRGAYFCHRQTCWEAALAGGRLGHALRTHLTPGERETLLAFSATCPSSAGTGERARDDV